MGDVVPFKRKTASERHGKKILCRSNFHKWMVVKENQFDVKQGKLVTLYRCARCGATKTEAR
jgi:hypothetical protein